MALSRLVIDTNAYSRLMEGDERVLDLLAEADAVLMSSFVLGELFTGFKGGQRERRNRELLRAFLARPTVKLLFATDATAEVFADVKGALKRRGKPISINDVWIAAHALEHAATLVTFDAHFQHVAGLQLYSLD